VKAGDRIYEDVVADFLERYKVRPGITGWAQVNGLRGNTFTEDHLMRRFASDVEYIRNWSFELDLCIMLKTVWGGFRGKNAF
jgi:lipopolysaccharide/colanic/teichoic acid biosynthesis glycosyltransferase